MVVGLEQIRWLAVGIGLGVAGCATHYIPNTDVEDTDENRRIIQFCERYRRALEQKDTATLLAMASPRYYEDGGNVDPTDDMDYEGLKAWLGTRFEETKAIRYEIRYRRIEKGENNKIYVIYTYSASWRSPGLTQDDWKHKVSDNRLELEVDGDSYKILAGM
ncbi:MAG: hypothetical protein RMJ98_08565 [Myxococcales bacterium]|nr:hypothetical protein [Polyangiaceae bacterium]MDW8249340.1 hypothetical protein [Myxococcales bacterium]